MLSQGLEMSHKAPEAVGEKGGGQSLWEVEQQSAVLVPVRNTTDLVTSLYLGAKYLYLLFFAHSWVLFCFVGAGLVAFHPIIGVCFCQSGTQPVRSKLAGRCVLKGG